MQTCVVYISAPSYAKFCDTVIRMPSTEVVRTCSAIIDDVRAHSKHAKKGTDSAVVIPYERLTGYN